MFEIKTKSSLQLFCQFISVLLITDILTELFFYSDVFIIIKNLVDIFDWIVTLKHIYINKTISNEIKKASPKQFQWTLS